jgi:CTP-dependent riboflavin kinase
MQEEVTHPGIKIADRLIASATQLTYLIEECAQMKRPVKHLEKIVQALKMAAMFELQTEKAACEKALSEQQKDKMIKVKEVKDFVEKVVSHRGIDNNWTENYFENLRKVL